MNKRTRAALVGIAAAVMAAVVPAAPVAADTSRDAIKKALVEAIADNRATFKTTASSAGAWTPIGPVDVTAAVQQYQGQQILFLTFGYTEGWGGEFDGDSVFWTDDVSLHINGTEAACDPGFEDGPGGTCWTPYAGYPGQGSEVTSSDAYTGTFSALHCGWGSACWDDMEQWITVPGSVSSASTTFAITGQTRDDNHDGSDCGGVAALYYDAALGTYTLLGDGTDNPFAYGVCEDALEYVGPTSHGRTVGLKLAKHLVMKGTVGVADNYLPCRNGVPVKLQKKKSGKWATIATATTDNTGFYKKKVADKKGTYRAVVKQFAPDADNVCGGAKSASKKHSH